jgi:uncharacterized membrane protein
VQAAVTLTDNLVLTPALPTAWAVALAAAALVVIIATGVRRLPTGARGRAATGRGRRAAMIVLRVLAAVGVAMLVLQPRVRWQGTRQVLPQVVWLADASRSMDIRDAAAASISAFPPAAPDVPPGASPVPDESLSRRDALRLALDDSADAYRRLASRAAVRPVAFGAAARPASTLVPQATEPRTNLAAALDALAASAFSAAARDAGSNAPAAPAAVVIVSDGRATRGGSAETAARRLAARGVRVHAVGVGSASATDRVRDVAVRDLRAPERVFAGNRPQVRAVVATLGLAGQTLEAVLTVGGREVDRRTVRPDTNRDAAEVVFTPALDEPGLARLAVTVVPVQGELIAGNNRAETAVRVEQGGVRVLYLDGRLTPEGKFMARALGEAKELDLERRVLVGGPASPDAPQPADLDDVDVLVLGDVPAAAIPPATIARLAERVRSGQTALLALGGLASYGAGGWADTPLADLLPFALRSTDGQVDGPLRVKPTPEGIDHFILRGDVGAALSRGRDGLVDGQRSSAGTPPAPAPKTLADALAHLPPLAGASEVGPLHPTARLLAASEGGAPVLAVRDLGAGRAAALTVDTTWQWVLAPGDVDGADVHRRLWRQLVLWLARRDARPTQAVWVMTDRARYAAMDPAAPVTVRVTAHAASGRPRVSVTGPALSSIVEMSPSGNDWQGVLRLTEPGEYTLTAEVDPGGHEGGASDGSFMGKGAVTLSEAKPADSRAESVTLSEAKGLAAEEGPHATAARTTFVVEVRDEELLDVLADHDALRRIAAAGGGRFVALGGEGEENGAGGPASADGPADLDGLLRALADDLAPQTVLAPRDASLASGRVFLALLLGVMAADWGLRRMAG